MNRFFLGYIGVGVNSILLPLGQFYWKRALVDGYTISVFFSVSFLLGALCYVLGTVFWFFALSVFPLSKIYPFVSLSYLIGALIGVFILNERLTPLNVAGYVLLSISITFIGMK